MPLKLIIDFIPEVDPDQPLEDPLINSDTIIDMLFRLHEEGWQISGYHLSYKPEPIYPEEDSDR